MQYSVWSYSINGVHKFEQEFNDFNCCLNYIKLSLRHECRHLSDGSEIVDRKLFYRIEVNDWDDTGSHPLRYQSPEFYEIRDVEIFMCGMDIGGSPIFNP